MVPELDIWYKNRRMNLRYIYVVALSNHLISLPKHFCLQKLELEGPFKAILKDLYLRYIKSALSINNTKFCFIWNVVKSVLFRWSLEKIRSSKLER